MACMSIILMRLCTREGWLTYTSISGGVQLELIDFDVAGSGVRVQQGTAIADFPLEAMA